MLIHQSPLLTAAGFRHGFTTRIGGVSSLPCDSLNFSIAPQSSVPREQQLIDLQENIWRVQKKLGLSSEHFYCVRQVHGNHVFLAQGDPIQSQTIEADAIVAQSMPYQEQPTVAVFTADCVPLLCASPTTGMVACIHAGWQGIVKGIIPATLDFMDHLGAFPLLIAAGPCIGGCCFEVERATAEAIVDSCSNPHVIERSHHEKRYVNLRKAARSQLETRSIPPLCIENVGGCTYCNKELYFSYRRDGERAGRLLSLIEARAANTPSS
ncbi:polyphenol oxidase family protein [Pajaroellobacter abortibovis]|nr:polyphenol oxidase family protein [Pajaroellobacter abortibovis]